MKEKSLSGEINEIADNPVVKTIVSVVAEPDVCLYQPFFDSS